MAPSLPSNMPQHVAIVMDGNGRWAAKRFLPRIAGHNQGVVALRRCVKACVERGIGVLTVFAFSSENWNRPPEEVSGLMDLLVPARCPSCNKTAFNCTLWASVSACLPTCRPR
jgi:undecaprenyl diphosphate synthase